jgi:hypothetical protein
MAYQELFKSFDRVRDYMRDFYVYGFKNRLEYDQKSARSYDNERRRINSLLGTHMFFRQNASGRYTFLSVNSREIRRNPLYGAFKAKIFTPNDIRLHFCLLDILADGEKRTVRELTERLADDYPEVFENEPDESTIRKKLKEYADLGIVYTEKSGRKLMYGRPEDAVELCGWKDAAAFFSEADPLGVVGSYLLDKYADAPDCFSFKHHYILHALESEILCDLLAAIDKNLRVEIQTVGSGCGKQSVVILPLRVCIGTQTGRRYLMAHRYCDDKIAMFRLDGIRRVTEREKEPLIAEYKGLADRYAAHMWGVSSRTDAALEHIEMTVRIEPDESFIVQRLSREKRCGRVEAIGDRTFRYVADVYDALEMLPWIRTFIGRIESLVCSNKTTEKRFRDDLIALTAMYGDADDAVL